MGRDECGVTRDLRRRLRGEEPIAGRKKLGRERTSETAIERRGKLTVLYLVVVEVED